MTFDLLIANARVVRPGADEPVDASIAVDGGRIVDVGPDLSPADAREVVDAAGRLAFPGAVDGHQHWGIYNPLDIDTASESRASAQGGVTTGLTYMRTGQYYLNRGGSYAEFFPEVLRLAEGRAYVDYAFHLAPMQAGHIDELGMLVDEFGVSSFKIFMFYGSHGLHGRSADQASFLMTPPGERYDLAHFEFVMRGVQRIREQRPDLADGISLSLHCETAEIMAAYTKLVEEAGELKGLAAYSASRPAHSEGLAITIASYLAHETGLPAINLLHLSGEKAIESALRMAAAFPHVDFRREVTIGHLIATYDTAAGLGGKVNPPLRAESDRQALWRAVLAGQVDWVVSDHACCRDEAKFGTDRDDVFLAKSGFGGAEYLLPALITEGRRQGLPLGRVADLVCANPAKRYGLWPRKGDLAVGFDADVVLVDPDRTWTVTAEASESTQEYTPFEGFELTARVDDVWLRGQRILRDGAVVGTPRGEYLRRPVGR
ncbi:dihydroorotase [Micromonospora cathayae]|uniref:Dihydroorotase family protein n=1 Tax=Micromonospora cathayae TaxID=3028804 RepID=A0ABY7ZJV4_9ACTN|nr:dihydroorotase family protein [Micromonospora sp. HUAS 3]WDZ83270.1 dihydroorotase family protein [Micromonospora sp. HUAS 3]